MTTQTTMLGVPEPTPEPPRPFPTCRECVHFNPARNMATGRVLRSQKGACSWRPDVAWSLAYLNAMRGWSTSSAMIGYPSEMWAGTDATKCVQFKRKETK